jgi:hypothetical protein
MAIRWAVATGNWSATATWNGGTLPAVDDDVYSNGFTVTINQSIKVLSLRNSLATGVTTASGGFSVAAGGFTIEANLIQSSSTLLTCTHAGEQSVLSIVGNVSHTGSSAANYTIQHNGTGTLNISGQIDGPTGVTAGVTVRLSNVSTVNITGNLNGNRSYALLNLSTGTVNITGNCTGPSVVVNAQCVYNGSTGTINITGNCYAGVYPAVNNLGDGTVTIVGGCYASSTNNAVIGASVSQVTAVTGPLVPYYATGAGAATSGIAAVYCARVLILQSAIASIEYVMLGSEIINFSVPDRSYISLRPPNAYFDSIPQPSDVRAGVKYLTNVKTGTCAVPPAGSVVSGVPVDNTVGTATITAANIRSALGMSSANLDTQLSGLSSGQTTINTNVLSRLASADYTVPPTAASIAAAVWGAATRTLTTAIDNSATVAAAVWSYASGRTVTGGTVDTLTNPPSVPSAAQIASQVRTELAIELARLDAAISTRLAASSYSTPPTAAAIATAVNSALDRTGYSLTTAERQAIATAVEQSILNENDGQAILNAIVGAIGNQNIDQIALVAAIRTDLERNGGTLATRLAASAYTAPPTAAANASAVRSELSPELANLDVTVSSRLATSGYTTPPSASTIASAVWSAATRTLTTAIDNSSTIASAVWSAVSRTITGGTVDTLTNAPTVPTPSQIASQVRTELSTELSRIDVTVSSRLAPGGTLARVTLTDTTTTLTNAPDVPTGPEIAEAVREELTPELNRVANCATVETTGDQIAALS